MLMNLNCLNTIITDNLVVNIDISKLNSWNLNNELSVISLNRWNNSCSDDLLLYDFGLTAFDNGRVDAIDTGLNITQNDTYLSLYRIGYNDNSGGTYYSGYTMNSITGNSIGNYFALNGGYLQGFFKLEGYNYELLPPRYNNGITIETLIEILNGSSGIFYYMGTRAEDKYNPYYSGETILVSANTINYGGKYQGQYSMFTGITTSENNYLNSYEEKEVKINAFSQPEFSDITINESFSKYVLISNLII